MVEASSPRAHRRHRLPATASAPPTAPRARSPGASPNQLYAAALNNNRLYITGILRSRRAARRAPSRLTDGTTPPTTSRRRDPPTVYVVDTNTNMERAAERVTMTRTVERALQHRMTPDTRGAALPAAPGWTSRSCRRATSRTLTAYGADAVFRLRFNADFCSPRRARPDVAFVNSTPAAPCSRGSSRRTSRSTTRAPSAFRGQRRVAQRLGRAALHADRRVRRRVGRRATGMDAARNTGQRFFVTGLAAGRSAARVELPQSCHPDGPPTGQRRWGSSPAAAVDHLLDGSFDRMGNQRLFNWTAIFDETHPTSRTTPAAPGGVGAVVHRPNDGATRPPSATATASFFDGRHHARRAAGGHCRSPQAASARSASFMPDGAAMPLPVLDD